MFIYLTPLLMFIYLTHLLMFIYLTPLLMMFFSLWVAYEKKIRLLRGSRAGLA